jgi:hypothetical protein
MTDRHHSEDRRIVKARVKRTPGRVVRIDLEDGRCAYGRQLTSVNVEFYDRVRYPDDQVNLLELVATPVASTIWVGNSAFRRPSGWALLDVVTLTEHEATKIHRYAKPDAVSRRVTIYYQNPVSGSFGERPATIDECRDLEIAAVWDPGHVEDRLRDHFAGRPNAWVESLRLKG